MSDNREKINALKGIIDSVANPLHEELAQLRAELVAAEQRADQAERERDEWKRRVEMAQTDSASFYEPQLKVASDAVIEIGLLHAELAYRLKAARESRKRLVALARANDNWHIAFKEQFSELTQLCAVVDAAK